MQITVDESNKTAAPMSETAIPPLVARWRGARGKLFSNIDKWTRKMSTASQERPCTSEKRGDGVHSLGDQGGQGISSTESNSVALSDIPLVAWRGLQGSRSRASTLHH